MRLVCDDKSTSLPSAVSTSTCLVYNAHYKCDLYICHCGLGLASSTQPAALHTLCDLQPHHRQVSHIDKHRPLPTPHGQPMVRSSAKMMSSSSSRYAVGSGKTSLEMLVSFLRTTTLEAPFAFAANTAPCKSSWSSKKAIQPHEDSKPSATTNRRPREGYKHRSAQGADPQRHSNALRFSMIRTNSHQN